MLRIKCIMAGLFIAAATWLGTCDMVHAQMAPGAPYVYGRGGTGPSTRVNTENQANDSLGGQSGDLLDRSLGNGSSGDMSADALAGLLQHLVDLNGRYGGSLFGKDDGSISQDQGGDRSSNGKNGTHSADPKGPLSGVQNQNPGIPGNSSRSGNGQMNMGESMDPTRGEQGNFMENLMNVLGGSMDGSSTGTSGPDPSGNLNFPIPDKTGTGMSGNLSPLETLGNDVNGGRKAEDLLKSLLGGNQVGNEGAKNPGMEDILPLLFGDRPGSRAIGQDSNDVLRGFGGNGISNMIPDRKR